MILAIAAAVPVDPYEVFARTRAAWEAAAYPRHLRYDVVVRAEDAGQTKTNTYRTFYSAQTNAVSADDVSVEQREHPHVPPAGVAFFGFAIGGPARERPVDILGTPALAPNYSFGVATYVSKPFDAMTAAERVAQIRKEFHDPDPRTPHAAAANAGLKIIGSVEAVRRSYTIAYDGMDTLDGHSDYHISLTPTGDPHRYRLRELWIDAKTYATDKLVSDGNFTVMPEVGTQWTVTFGEIDGAPVITNETANAPLAVGAQHYTHVSVSFERVTVLTVMPRFLDIALGPKPTLTEPDS